MNKKQQLRELVRHVIRQTLRELMGSDKLPSHQNSLLQQTLDDPTQPPVDAMSPLEKQQFDRDQEKLRKDAITQNDASLKSIKAKMEFNKRELDQQKRFQIPNLQKKLQQLKGGV